MRTKTIVIFTQSVKQRRVKHSLSVHLELTNSFQICPMNNWTSLAERSLAYNSLFCCEFFRFLRT